MKTKVSLIILLLVASLFSCSKQNQSQTVTSKAESKLNIITTIYSPYDFAKHITQDKADVSMLIRAGTETHSFEPTPQDIIKIQNCDVFVYVGGENDEWVGSMLESIDNKNLKVIKLLDLVEIVEEEIVEGMEHEHEHEDEEHHEEAEHDEHEEEHHHEEEVEWDEHVWTSPVNAITICNTFAKVFSELDEKNASFYAKNCKTYTDELSLIDSSFRDIVKNAKRKTVVFGDRFPLRYFVEEYGLEYFAAFPGCSSDTEPSAATVAFLSDKIKEENIPVVFKIELSNGNIANSLSESTGAKVETFYTCHNVTKEDFDKGTSYIDFMKKNIEVLKEALN